MEQEAKRPWENIDLGIQEKMRRERLEKEGKRPRLEIPVPDYGPPLNEYEERREEKYGPEQGGQIRYGQKR